MANTIAGVNLAQIASEALTLPTLQPQPFTLLSRFSTDFSDEIRDMGESIATRVATVPTIADIATAGYAHVDQTLTAKTITLNKFKGVTMGFHDLEVSKSKVDLQRIFARPALLVTINAVLDDLFALILNATFSSKVTKTAAQFDADVVADMAQTLSDANSIGSRILVVEPSHYTSLVKDNAIQAAYAYGSASAIQDNRVSRVHGFDVFDYSDVPGNSESLVGFGCTPDALLVAARTVAVPDNFPGQVVNTIEPVSGVPIQWRYWYNPDAASQPGAHMFSVGMFYGVAAGNTAPLVRVVTA